MSAAVGAPGSRAPWCDSGTVSGWPAVTTTCRPRTVSRASVPSSILRCTLVWVTVTRRRVPLSVTRKVSASQSSGSRGSNVMRPPWSRMPPKPRPARSTRRRPRRRARRRRRCGAGRRGRRRAPAVKYSQREVVVADLGRDDRLHDGRQRRVARGERVVVLEVGPLLLGRELVALQEQRQHHVGLLEHLEAVDHQRVVVQQQRPLAPAGVCARSQTSRSRKCGVLRVDAEAARRTGCASPRRRAPTPSTSASSSVEPRRTMRSYAAGSVLGQLGARARRGAQVEARHDVGEQVVVDDGRVLVGPGDAVDVEDVVAVRTRQKPRSAHMPRGLDEDVDALAVRGSRRRRWPRRTGERVARCRRRCGTARCRPRSRPSLSPLIVRHGNSAPALVELGARRRAAGRACAYRKRSALRAACGDV